MPRHIGCRLYEIFAVNGMIYTGTDGKTWRRCGSWNNRAVKDDVGKDQARGPTLRQSIFFETTDKVEVACMENPLIVQDRARHPAIGPASARHW